MTTLQELLSSYLSQMKEEQLSDSTKRSYALHVRQFIAFIEMERGLTLTETEAIVFRTLVHKFLSREQKASAVNARASALKHFFKVTGLPCETIDRPTTKLTTREPLTQTELNRFIEEAYRFPLRDKVIALLLASTGMRLREFVQLNWNSVNFANGECTIEIASEPNSRVLRLDVQTQDALVQYRNSIEYQTTLLDDRPLFTDKNRGRLSMRAVADSVKKIGWSANLQVNPALLRLTRLLLLAQATSDVTALTNASGYSSRESARRLIKASRNDLSRMSIERKSVYGNFRTIAPSVLYNSIQPSFLNSETSGQDSLTNTQSK